MDGMWKFHLDEKSIGENEGWNDGLPGKEMIPVPASFQDFYTDKDTREFCGDVWYEKDMFVPEEWEGKNIYVRFGAATHRAVV
jgi:beta-glucuronidase